MTRRQYLVLMIPLCVVVSGLLFCLFCNQLITRFWLPSESIDYSIMVDADTTTLPIASIRAVDDSFSTARTIVSSSQPRYRMSHVVPMVGPFIPLVLGGVVLQASVATTSATRKQGLSHTSVLPADVVKLFVFASSSQWTFWMKDMLYSIDIIWLNENYTVVYIARNVSPATYPKAFSPTVSARYVIETNAGFVASHNIVLGSVASF